MAFQSVLQRMHDRLFARLGEGAFLRGTEPCKVNIERNVQIDYASGDAKFQESMYSTTVTIANIPSAMNPKPGDALTVNTETPNGVCVENFVIDALAENNGFLTRCILR